MEVELCKNARISVDVWKLLRMEDERVGNSLEEMEWGGSETWRWNWCGTSYHSRLSIAVHDRRPISVETEM